VVLSYGRVVNHVESHGSLASKQSRRSFSLLNEFPLTCVQVSRQVLFFNPAKKVSVGSVVVAKVKSVFEGFEERCTVTVRVVDVFESRTKVAQLLGRTFTERKAMTGVIVGTFPRSRFINEVVADLINTSVIAAPGEVFHHLRRLKPLGISKTRTYSLGFILGCNPLFV
jgi:hypothetical protein